MPLTSRQLDPSELVELLQQSAVEHLTRFRQLEAQDRGKGTLFEADTKARHNVQEQDQNETHLKPSRRGQDFENIALKRLEPISGLQATSLVIGNFILFYYKNRTDST